MRFKGCNVWLDGGDRRRAGDDDVIVERQTKACVMNYEFFVMNSSADAYRSAAPHIFSDDLLTV